MYEQSRQKQRRIIGRNRNAEKRKDAIRAMYEKEINYLKKLKKFHIQNEKKYKLLAENIIDVIWVLDVATQKTDVRKSICYQMDRFYARGGYDSYNYRCLSTGILPKWSLAKSLYAWQSFSPEILL